MNRNFSSCRSEVRGALEKVAILVNHALGAVRNSPVLSFFLALLVTSSIGTTVQAQANEWTWMGGSSSVGVSGGIAGIYGEFKTPSKGNSPGSRWSSSSWTDKDGNFWLFGGWGYDSNDGEGWLNDLWEYNPSTNEWAWMGGSSRITGNNDGIAGVYGTLQTPSPSNSPGSRENAMSWTDKDGNFWLFGGYGYDSNDQLGYLNDLWEFDLSSGEWVWMGGSKLQSDNGQPGVYGELKEPSSTNMPGGRWNSDTWTDLDGNLWLFGGQGADSLGNQGFLNDLWKFQPSTNEWTWMGGSDIVPVYCPDANSVSTCGESGVYGTLSVPSTSNIPGGRFGAFSWTDKSGNLWLFGGNGFDSSGQSVDLNDLWTFAPASGEWAWVGGESTVVNESGVIGLLGIPAAANLPPAREEEVGWTDGNGNLWLFGGTVGELQGSGSGMQDLWEFSPASNEWALMGGSTSNESDGNPGIYGTKGFPAATNIPGGRDEGVSWTDNSGNFWLFGGYGYSSSEAGGVYLNDLWEYTPSAPAPVPSFAMYISPTSPNVVRGTSFEASINTIVGDGFDSPISLTASGLPDGVTVSFSPSVINGAGSSKMTISVPLAGTAGAFTIYVTGTSGSLTETVSSYTTTANFSLGASPGTVIVPAGDSGTSTITVAAASNYQSPITLSYSTYQVLDGVTISFNPGYTIGSGTSQMIVSVGSNVIPYTYAIGIVGTSGSIGNATFFLKVTAPQSPPTFALTASLSALTVTTGGVGNINLSVTPKNGFDSPVSFACSGLPAGATCSFSQNPVTPSGASVATQLTIYAAPQSSKLRTAPRTFLPMTTLAAALCLFGWRRRRSLKWMIFMVVAFAGLGLVSSCGGGSGGGSTVPPPPPPTTSTVTVTATSGSFQQTAKIALTVN